MHNSTYQNIIGRIVSMCLVVLTIATHSFAQINWIFGTANPTGGVPANLTVGALAQGNNNGTTALLSTNSASSGYTGASGSFNAGAAAFVGALNTATSTYFEVTLTPNAGYKVSITNVSFGSRSTSTGPQIVTVRSSLNYSTVIANSSVTNNATWALVNMPFTAVESAFGTPITLRIYGSNGTGSPTVNTANWRIDDLNITATVIAAPPTVTSSSPTSGGIDTRITVNGTNFTTTSVVTVGGTSVRRLWYYSPTKIVVQVGDNTPVALNNSVVVDGVTSPNGFDRIDCASPLSVSASPSTSTTGIEVTWTNPTTVNRADVVYRIAGSGAEFSRINTGKVTAGAQNHTLMGLAANTNYEVYVQLRCDGTTWSNWTVASASVNSGNVGGVTGTCNKPTVTAPTNNTTLAAQQTTLTWSTVANATSYQVFAVEVDNGTPPIPVGGTSQTWTTTTTSYLINFLKPNTKYRLQVRAYCAAGSIGEYSDERFVTTGAGTLCMAPTNFNAVVSGTAGNPADINFSWSGDSGASGSPKYTVQVQYPNGTIFQKTSDTQSSLWGGFSGGQTYQYAVRTNCSNTSSNFSAWQNVAVVGTYATCPTITAVNVSNPKSWGALVSWTPSAVDNAPEPNRSYWVQYWNTNDVNTIYTLVQDSSKVQLLVGKHTGLTTGQSYGARVWYLCGGQLQGVVHSNPATFTLLGTTAQASELRDGVVSPSFVLAPNPAHMSAEVHYVGVTTHAISLSVVDVLGREVYHEVAAHGQLHTRLQVGHLQAGIYLVKVQEGEQVQTKRLVVE